jgi:hypothetical protein
MDENNNIGKLAIVCVLCIGIVAGLVYLIEFLSK